MPRVLSAFICLLFLSFAPAPLLAQCNGQDTRHLAPPEHQQNVQERLANEPFVSGNHWIARRGDRSIHVVGTMHLNTPGIAERATALSGILAEMDALYLEATIEDLKHFERRLSLSPELTFITEGPSLIDRLPAEDWQSLSQMAQSSGIPGWMAAKMRPWFLAISLSIMPCMKGQKDIADGLDHRLAVAAQDLKIPSFSLEDPMIAIHMLNQGTVDEQIAQMRPHLAMMGNTQGNADTIASMFAAYFEEEALAFMELQKEDFLSKTDLPQSEAIAIWDDFFDDLIVQRNQNWMPVIEAAEGDRIMVAVGTLHLPGTGGLLDLLQAEGYELERAPF